MARNEPQINLRIPESLKVGIEAAAKRNNRSVTAEVVARLQRSLDADDVLGGGDALDTAAYQAMAAVVLDSSIDRTGLTSDQDKALAQLSRIGANIIAKMEFNKGDKQYITSVIRPTPPESSEK